MRQTAIKKALTEQERAVSQKSSHPKQDESLSRHLYTTYSHTIICILFNGRYRHSLIAYSFQPAAPE